MVGTELSNVLKEGWRTVIGRPTTNANKKACQYHSISWLPLVFLLQVGSLCKQLGNCFVLIFFFLDSLCWSGFPILCSTHVISSSSDSASYTALENCCFFILALSNVLHNLKAMHYFLPYLTPGSQHPFILSKTSWENMFWFPVSPPATLKLLLSCMLLSSLIPWGTWFNKGQIKGIVKEKLPYTL